MTKNNDLQGFKVLRLKTSSGSNITHSIFIKEHSVRAADGNRPYQRTLFMLNVPPFVDEECIRCIFKNMGKIISVELTDKPSSSSKLASDKDSLFKPHDSVGFKVAYVVFSKPSELKKALLLNETIACSDTGINKWIRDYNSAIPSIEKMQIEIERDLKKYDEDAKSKLEKDKSLGEADDEGWVTVTKHSRKPGFERKESVENKIIRKEKVRQQKKELKNFYTFQIRESKMKHIIDLRQKFEEDKKKIAMLKESRKFRPF